MSKTNSSPGSLAGVPGDCTSLCGACYFSGAEIKNLPSILHLRSDTLKSIRSRYPIEGAILELMIADGRVRRSPWTRPGVRNAEGRPGLRALRLGTPLYHKTVCIRRLQGVNRSDGERERIETRPGKGPGL